MSKYAPLEKYLKSTGFESIPMVFSEIESIIKDKLPPSARKHRPWWSNNTSNSAITQSWIAAGFKVTRVNMNDESLVFVKIGKEEKSVKSSNTLASKSSDVHPAFGCLQGTVTICEDTDLTAPAMSEWAEIAMNPKLYNE